MAPAVTSTAPVYDDKFVTLEQCEKFISFVTSKTGLDYDTAQVITMFFWGEGLCLTEFIQAIAYIDRTCAIKGKLYTDFEANKFIVLNNCAVPLRTYLLAALILSYKTTEDCQYIKVNNIIRYFNVFIEDFETAERELFKELDYNSIITPEQYNYYRKKYFFNTLY